VQCNTVPSLWPAQALLLLLAGVQARPFSAPMRLSLCGLYALLASPQVRAAARASSVAICQPSCSNLQPNPLTQPLDQQPNPTHPNLTQHTTENNLTLMQAAARQMRKLEIKNIQLDSLASHHLLPALVALGAADDAGSMLAGTLHLFDEHAKDVGDSLMVAYDAGTYTKVGLRLEAAALLGC
jgi:hypothetical protein